MKPKLRRHSAFSVIPRLTRNPPAFAGDSRFRGNDVEGGMTLVAYRHSALDAESPRLLRHSRLDRESPPLWQGIPAFAGMTS
jgi:hypothetical protein